jgi:hypothetical protein
MSIKRTVDQAPCRSSGLSIKRVVDHEATATKPAASHGPLERPHVGELALAREV